MSSLSNNVKVVLFPSNIADQNLTQRDAAMTVLNYEYVLKKDLNPGCVSYGVGSGSYLNVKVRVGTRDNVNLFYEKLSQSFTSSFSFVFNAVFDERGHLSDYDDTLIAEGYVVDLMEVYERKGEDAGTDVMNISLRILVTSITIAGENIDFVHNF